MPYGETKVYFDGSHYIAIPHTTRPNLRRTKTPEETKRILRLAGLDFKYDKDDILSDILTAA